MEYDTATAQQRGGVRAVSQESIGKEALETNTLALLRQRGVTLRQSLNEQQEELQLLLQEASNEADRQAHLLVQLEATMLRHQASSATTAAAAAAAAAIKSSNSNKQHAAPNSTANARRPLARMTQIEVRKDLVGRVMRTVLQVDKSVQTDVNMHLFRLGVELSTRVTEPADDEDFGDDPPPLPTLYVFVSSLHQIDYSLLMFDVRRQRQEETIPYALRK